MPLSNADKTLGPGRAWQVEGSIGTQYTVIEWKATRFFSCNCPDWRTRRNKLNGTHTIDAADEQHCKHILEVIRTPGFLAKGVKPVLAVPAAALAVRQLEVSTRTTSTDGRAALLSADEEV